MKNLCPENDIAFENSQTIRFETPLPIGSYTVSAIVESTDTDSSVCLMLFTYADGSTKEVYIGRSPVDSTERVFKIFELTQDATKVRIYASEGYSLSVGDTATFTKLMIETGDQMTDYLPYGEEEPDEPENPDQNWSDVILGDDYEVVVYYAALAGVATIQKPYCPTCRETMLLQKLLDPSYEVQFTHLQSRVEAYLWNLITNKPVMLLNTPQSDKEKYLHVAIGGTVDEMPNPDACLLNFWMNEWIKKLKKG